MLKITIEFIAFAALFIWLIEANPLYAIALLICAVIYLLGGRKID